MFTNIYNLKIHYKVSGHGAPIILLHGWGASIDYFKKLQDCLAQRFCVYAIDLPGFGLSMTPEGVWDTLNYANLIKEFIIKMNIDEPILLGHSFGGKIIINLVAKGLVATKKIILIDSAGIKLPKSFKIKLRIYFFKIFKFIARLPILKNIFRGKIESYKRKFGSTDYKNSQGVMRQILVKSVNENVKELLPKIKVPTLLLWGENDPDTLLQEGIIMQQNISGSQLKVFSGSGHFPFLDSWEDVKKELERFLS